MSILDVWIRGMMHGFKKALEERDLPQRYVPADPNRCQRCGWMAEAGKVHKGRVLCARCERAVANAKSRANAILRGDIDG